MELKTTLTRALAGAAIAAAASFSATAQETTLTITSWAPPSHGMNSILFPQLIAEMEAATDGRVTGEIKYGLASPPAQYDLILDGAADIGWVFHGYTPGRFVSTKLIELPGYEGSAEAASVAHWRSFKEFFEPLGEHIGVNVIGLMTHGEGVLHTSADVASLDDISGLKLRIGGGVAGDSGTALGATGINVPAPEVYTTLASNAADGVMMPMEGKASFKLYEVAKNTYTVPGGFYRGSFAIIMNTDKWDSLSDADKAALEPLFGEHLSRMAGAMWDQIDAAGLQSIEDNADNALVALGEADVAKWNELRQPIIDAVVAEVSAKGVDGAAARDFIIKEMAGY